MRVFRDREHVIMSTEPLHEPTTDPPRNGPVSRTSRRLQIGVRGLIAIVACCGALAWSGRTLWESQHPSAAASRQLLYGTPMQCATAVRELMQIGMKNPDPALPPLISALGDASAEIRVATAEALGYIAGEDALARPAGSAAHTATAALIRSLGDREPSVRIAAILALEHIATMPRPVKSVDLPGIIDALAGAVGDRDEEARLTALKSLLRCRKLGPKKTPPATIIAALHDRSPRIRTAAVHALASYPCDLDPWLPFLLQSLDDSDSTVAAACWYAFERVDPPAFSAAAIPALIAALDDRSPAVRARAARALVPHANDPRVATTIPALLNLLAVPQEDITPPSPGWQRWSAAVAAAELLGRLAPGTPSAGQVIMRLTELLPKNSGLLRWRAIAALGGFGPAAESAVPALIEVLRRAPEWSSDGTYIVKSLARIAPGTRSADAALAAVTGVLDSSSIARLAALESLPAFGEKAQAVIPRLRELCKPGHPQDIRRAAAAALDAIEDATSRGGESR